MAGQQLDLFAADPIGIEPDGWSAPPPLRAADLADAALIAAFPDARLATAPSLAAEAGRRRLVGAIPALERLCRRLVGFGRDRVVPEQASALQALAAIGGAEARLVVTRLIADQIVQGPNLATALSAAAGLGAPLPPFRVAELLQDADPSVRAGACRCVRSAAPQLGLLIELLDDLHPPVATAAAMALGRIGRAEARPLLIWLLRTQPSAELIEALTPIADEEVIVAFGRAARAMADLTRPVLEALEQLDDPRAAVVASALRDDGPAANSVEVLSGFT
jgi:HEAT repeat protein